jgi:transcriptional regulator with XRE-family HTH domain
MERVARQFLRALRGRRSQVQLARRLGYRGNPITDWERGERFPTAHEALRAAQLVGVDVSAAFARFAPSCPLQRSGELLLGAWLSALRGETAVVELAQRAGLSRFSIARWLSGKAKPRLPDFFRLLDAITNRLPQWAAELVPIDALPLLKPRYEAALAAKHLAFDLPWTEAVLRLLETAAFHGPRGQTEAQLAECLGISTEHVHTCVKRLLAARVIARRGRQLVVRDQGAVDTQGGKQALHSLKRHWSQVAAARLKTPREADYFAYNVVSVSARDLERIRERLRVAFREIRSLVAASQPIEVAAVLNLQIVSFAPGDVGKGESRPGAV